MAHHDLARRLRAAVEACELTRSEIAERADKMPRQVLNNMIAGAVPGHRHLPNLARVLGVPLDWLMTGRTALEDRVDGYAGRLLAAASAGRGFDSWASPIDREMLRDYGMVSADKAPEEVQEYDRGLSQLVPAHPITLEFEQQLAVVDALSLALEHYEGLGTASARHLGGLRLAREVIVGHLVGGAAKGANTPEERRREVEQIRALMAKIDAAQRTFEGAPAAVGKTTAPQTLKPARNATKNGGVGRTRSTTKKGGA